MDLLTVNRKDFSLGRLVEGWSTLIWTERYQDPGEFELHTPLIYETMHMLPELSFCALRDSNEVMIVETHAIARDQTTGAPELVVKGRTLDSFLENRFWRGAAYGKTIAMNKHYTVRQAVEVWIWNAIVNDTGDDVVNPGKTKSTNDVLPNVVVSDSVPSASDGDSKSRKVTNGNVYPQMRQFLSSGKLGIRIIRPNGTKGRRVDPGSDGTFNTTSINPFTKLRFDIYQGRDKTDTVQFSYDAGDLVNPNYTFSSQNFKTGMFVDGDARTHYVTDPDALSGSNTGWRKRDGYVDGGQKDDGQTADDFEDSLQDQGLHALRREGKHISLIDTQISPLSHYKYNRHFRLGDRVRVEGEFKIKQNMWVTEFIRTQDDSGELGIPTLSTTPS